MAVIITFRKCKKKTDEDVGPVFICQAGKKALYSQFLSSYNTTAKRADF
jgi:hypothetical protein